MVSLSSIISNIETISIVVFIVVGLVLWLSKISTAHIGTVLKKAFAASIIPTGLVLLGCAFDPSLLSQLTGMGIYVAAAGLAVLMLAGETLAST